MASQRSRLQIWQRSYFPPQGGGKGGGGTTYNQQSTQIPPEVLARYNAVNAQAETAAQQPFQPYGGEFVAPVNQTQQGGIQNITNAAGTADPYFGAATGALNTGLGAAQPYYGTATGQVADAAASGAALNSQALGTLNSGLGAAQPFNAAAGNAYGGAYAGAQPYQAGATGLALAGTQAVDPNQLNINGFMSPYNDAVVQSTLGLVDQQQGRDLRSQRDQQIMSGGFGGDGANIGRSVLQGQQGLARANIASNLYNQNYSQALGAAQQQQGVGLGAAQANRAALQAGAGQLANIGQQGYQQGMGLGQAQQGLGQQIFGQGAAASQGQAAIGNQDFTQGLGAANANQALGQGQFAMGNTAAGTYAGLGTGQQGAQLAQGQAQIGAGTIGQQTQQAQDQAVYNQFLQQQGYPFQVAQFLANIAMGTGALSGSTTSGYSAAPQPFFSDERLKEDIRTIGHTKDGLRIVSYKYKGSPHTQIGMLAQDVEKKRPEAVGLAGGFKTVDYDAATRKALGGAVANDNAGAGYAEGGMPNFDQAGLAQLLLAHQAMYPGAAHDRAGVTAGTGPRGMQLIKPPSGSLPAPKAPPAPPAQPQQAPMLQQALGTVGQLSNAGKGAADLYKTGKAAVGEASDLYDRVAHGSTDKQIEDWSKYGSRPSDAPAPGLGAAGTGAADPAGLAPAAAVSATGPVSVSSLAPELAQTGTDVAAALPADDLIAEGLSLVAKRGGRIKRYAAGGMPYEANIGADYFPDELDDPLDPKTLAAEQKGLEPDKPGATSKANGAGGKGLGSAIGSIAGMGLGSLFGMPGVGSMIGGGLGGLFNKGGRAGYDVGGMIEDAPLEVLPDNILPFKPRGLAVPPREVAMVPPAAPPKLDDVDADIHGRYSDTLPASPPAAGLGAANTPPAAAQPLGPIAAPPASTGLAPAPAPQAVGPSPDNTFDAPDNVMQRMWTKESGNNQFKPDGTPLISSAGAVGYTQMQAAGPEAAKLAGVPYDPERVKYDTEYNKLLGTTWTKHLQGKYGDPYQAAAAYNAGEGGLKRARDLAAVKGGNYADYLPAETQDYLHVISGGKIGKPAGGQQVGNAMALVGDRSAPAAAGTTGDLPTGLSPQVDLSLPGKNNPKGDWLDRNEKYVVSGLTFLGNMLASPSHQLLGSVGSGLAAAAPAYAQYGMKEREAQQTQQGIQLGGQRLDLQQNAQDISLLAQLRQMQNARLGRGLAEDPGLASQISTIAARVAARGGPPTGTGSPGAGAAPRVAPSPATGAGDTGNPTPLTPPRAPPSTPPVTTPATPPAGGVPPDMAAKHAALRELPPQVTSQQFLQQLHPEQNPIELYKRADLIVDDGDPNGQHAQAVRRADAAVQSMKERGYAYDKNMMPIIVPGMPQTQRALQMIPQNTAWSQKESVANNERQGARQSLDLIRQALEDYQTNALGDVTANLQRYANAVGIPIPNGAKMNAAAVQEIIKQAAARAATAGDTDMARGLSRLSSIDPTKEPEANKQILAQSYADVNARDAKYNYLQPRISAVPQLDTPYEEQKWAEANPRKQFFDEAYKNIAVRGEGADISKMKDGHVYIIEPGQFPGVNQPTKYRYVRGADGKPQLSKVQ